jgi:hypothetical protein
MEQWKDIPGYEGLYQVSSEGRVRSLNRVNSKRKGRILLQSRKGGSKATGGYCFIQLFSGVAKSFYVHRLVAAAFIEPIEGKNTVDHINRDKLDNRVCNLRWASHADQALNNPGCFNHLN